MLLPPLYFLVLLEYLILWPTIIFVCFVRAFTYSAEPIFCSIHRISEFITTIHILVSAFVKFCIPIPNNVFYLRNVVFVSFQLQHYGINDLLI